MSKDQPRQFMPRVGGQPFRCPCGCNVFTQPQANYYVCNSCETVYKGDPAPAAPVRPETPECEKALASAEARQAIGDFIEWAHTQGYVLASYGQGEWLHPLTTSIADLLAAHFGLDRSKIDQEQEALLEYCRQVQAYNEELKRGQEGQAPDDPAAV